MKAQKRAELTTLTMSSQADEFPVIDFGEFETNPEKVSLELFKAAGKWGFLVLKNHGIPSEDVKNMFALVWFEEWMTHVLRTDGSQSKEFFEQPQEVKQEKWMNTMQIGYDYKESM